MTVIRLSHMGASDRLPGRSLHSTLLRGVCGKSYPVSWRWLVVTLALAVLSGCVSVHYQGPGEHITALLGETLTFGRILSFHEV